MGDLPMEIPTMSMINGDNGFHSATSDDSSKRNSRFSCNIIDNHNFCKGLHSWNANCCDAFLVSPLFEEKVSKPCKRHAVVTNRNQNWQGLEQDITARVSSGTTYKIYARVGVSGTHLNGDAEVIATLKLEYQHSKTKYINITRTRVSKEKWDSLKGIFILSDKPDRVVFFLEGPGPGVNLLIESVLILCDTYNDSRKQNNRFTCNIIDNHNFCKGLHSWNSNCCDAFLVSPLTEENILKPCKRHAVVTNRNKNWQGLEQDITARVSSGTTYKVYARVGVSGTHLNGDAEVIATLKLEYQHSKTKYINITRTRVSKKKRDSLEGTFILLDKPERVVFYLEGPGPQVNLFIESVLILCDATIAQCGYSEDGNIILNLGFEDGVNNWSRRGCKIVVHDSMGDGKILPKSGNFFACATERTQTWNGIQQEITGRVQRKVAYEVSAFVRIFGNSVTNATVRATLWVQTLDSREQYIRITSSQATNSDWVQLEGKFLINGSPSKVVIYLEGPPSGTDILLGGLLVKHAEKVPSLPPPIIENPDYGVNIIANSNLSGGTNGWFPLGSCVLNVVTGSPSILPPAARNHTLGPYEPLSGNCIHTTNRTQTWMGLAQMITDKVKLYVTYQVSAWVRLGPGATGPQNVNVALRVDSQCVNCGQVEINDADRWYEICGSFRIEKQAAKMIVYIQGPAAGISFMVAGLQIFAVDRQARFRHLRRQTDKIRKRDVTLKFSTSDSSSIHGTMIMVKQTQNSFPILDLEQGVIRVRHHIEDRCDTRSTPEKYISQILDLQQGVPVGGIGIQGDINGPVGPIVCSALDKLGTLGLPIWFTELDGSSVSEHMIADDLEVMLREAFAHPACEGIMLWGFWELFMSRETSHLVNAEGEINEAGNRFLELKKEWLSHAHGHVDEQGEFKFRGFLGTYDVVVFTDSKKFVKKVVVEKGVVPVVVPIS